MAQLFYIWLCGIIMGCVIRGVHSTCPPSSMEVHTSDPCSSCQSRCDTAVNEIRTSSDNEIECFCDVSCIIHGDCCRDFPIYCPDILALQIEMGMSVSYSEPTCMSLEVHTPDPCSSCKSRCAQTSSGNRNECLCDVSCLIHGDCCPDFHIRCEDIHAQAVEMSMSVSYSKPSCTSMPEFVYLDDGAVQTEDENRLVVQTCIDPQEICYSYYLTNYSEPNTFVPFLDPSTGVIFRNILCALCNGVKHVVPWEVNMQCNEVSTNNYYGYDIFPNSDEASEEATGYDDDLNKNNWTISSSEEYNHLLESGDYSCKYFFRQPPMYPKRTCLEDVIDTCTDTVCDNTSVPILCQNYGQDLYKEASFGSPYDRYNYGPNNKPTYKNIYCAICSGVERENLICGYEEKEYFGDFFPRPSSFSLTLLMDYSSGSNLRIGHAPCQTGEIWKHEEKRCIPITCPEGYHLVGESCQSDLFWRLLKLLKYL